MKTPKKILCEWLFAELAGTFVEGLTLYLPMGGVAESVLDAQQLSVTGGKLSGYSVTEGRIYPIATKEDVKAPYVTYDSLVVTYESTKDGVEPDKVSFRILCVDRSYTAVEALADAVETRVNNAYVVLLASCVEAVSRRSDFDSSTGEYIEELLFNINL